MGQATSIFEGCLWYARPECETPIWVESAVEHSDLERARRFASPEDASRFLWSRALLRYALADATGRQPEAIRLEERTGLAPRLSEGGGVYFSLSRSRSLVCVFVSKAGPVGVDTESLQALPDLEQLAAFVLSENESDHLRGRLDAEAFLAVWTRKEALAKALGTGLPDDARSLEVPIPLAKFRDMPWQRIDGQWIVATIRPPEGGGQIVSIVASLAGRTSVGSIEILPQATALESASRARIRFIAP